MERSEDRFKARTTERGKVWQQIADNLNSDHTLKFPSKKFGFFFRETGVIAGSTNFSSNKRSLRYQSSKTSRVFLKDVMELKHESITLSSLVRRALNPTCSNLLTLNLFFPPRWLRPRSRLSPANPRSLHRRVQGILRSLFPVVNVIRSSGIPSFTKNLLARSITSGKSNRTTLTFYPLELFWTVFICFRYFLF